MVSEEPLYGARDRVVSSGLRNVLRRENRRWWSPRSLLWLLAVWTVLANCLTIVLSISIPSLTANGKAADPATIQNVMAAAFFIAGGLAIVLGSIIRGHDSILKEREFGTASWIISKPVSRSSFVVAKVLANCIGMLLTVVLAQGIITYLLIDLTTGRPPDPIRYLSGLAIMGLYCTFFMVFAVSLSALVMSRGIALGIPMLAAIGGMLLALLCRYGGFMPQLLIQLNILSPANLNIVAWNTVGGMFPPGPDQITIVATLAWIAALIVTAVTKFERTEL